MKKNLEHLVDQSTGNVFLVDPSSGEVTDAVTVTVPAGSKFYTPKQQQWYKQRKQLLEEERMKKAMFAMRKDELGYFFFASTRKAYEHLSPATMARLIFLCTYLQRYDDDVLYLRKQTAMQYGDLSEVLGLSRNTVSTFIREASPFLSVLDDGRLRVDSTFFRRGTLPKGKHDSYQRIYIKSVRALYCCTPKNKHRLLGSIFLMLPYLNREHNILCTNPDEENIETVEAISLQDFCKIIKYDESNASRLRKEFDGICFPFKGSEEKLCSFFLDGNSPRKTIVCINPHLVYSGKDYSHIYRLGEFCKS